MPNKPNKTRAIPSVEGKRAAAERTHAAAMEIIDAEAEARRTKTERLQAARKRAEARAPRIVSVKRDAQ